MLKDMMGLMEESSRLSQHDAKQPEFVARRCPFDTEDRQVEDGGALVQPIIGLDSLSPDHKPDPPARVVF